MPTIIEASADIDAPPERVWSILLDLSSYAAWNPFTPRIDASLRVGEPVILHVAMKPGRRLLVQREICTVNDPVRHELGWGMTMLAPFVLRADRIQRLEPLPGGRTRYYTADTFSGLMLPLVMALYRADIQRGFESVARGLEAYAASSTSSAHGI